MVVRRKNYLITQFEIRLPRILILHAIFQLIKIVSYGYFKKINLRSETDPFEILSTH